MQKEPWTRLFALAALAIGVACNEVDLTTSPYRPPIFDASAGLTCPACATDEDCGGGICTQLGGDSYCAPACSQGSECTLDRACLSASSISGKEVKVCVPRTDVCSQVAGVQDAGAEPASDRCGSLVAPTVSASCSACSGKSDCQANGCFGGWWCNTATSKCQSPPSTCGASGEALDAGAPVTGEVTAKGGNLSRLLFAAVGDTRPASIDDTAGYPKAILEKIYSSVQAFSPRPAFVVSTGDYIFASPNGAESGPQLDAYLAGRSKYTGVIFPAMGNHECTGYTNSNCGPGTSTGSPNNYTSFMSKMLVPIEKTDPYYAVDVKGSDGSWTAKFVFIAANAWNATQETWLETTLSRNTTYTFIVRHEPKQADTAPGVIPSETIMSRHPYTLAIVGHTHTYAHYSEREVIVGNGGAPLTGNKNYGFAIFNQRPDGAIQVDMIDYASGQSDTRFRFALKADGTSAL